MADVFISYAREDRASAEKLAHALEAHGWSVWWDREILPGKDFSAVIGTEIAAAKTVVVLWSRSSVASNWVRDEAHEGLERSVLVPVLLDGSEPPMGYRAIQGVSCRIGSRVAIISASASSSRRSPPCRSRANPPPPSAWPPSRYRRSCDPGISANRSQWGRSLPASP